MELRNVALVGASGGLGKHILTALQADPAFKVTIISRHGSKATFPTSTKVIRVGDDYPEEDMVEAFKGQDAVVLSLAWGAYARHAALVDASIKAGVKRLVASTYGVNDKDLEAAKFFTPAAHAVKVAAELKERETSGWSWSSVCCGPFFDFIFGVTAFGFNPSEPQALIVDSGNRSFSTTTRATVGLAVARLLAKPAETANRSIYVSSVQTTTNELITAYKKAANKVDLSVKHSSSEEQMRVAKEYIATGESMLGQATFGIVVSAGENAKSDFEAERLLDNELLGLPIESVDQLVAGFLQERS